jgi:tol-pal system protein YbgF
MHRVLITGLGLAALSAVMLTSAADARADDSKGVQVAALFGESDEEKAARQQHEDNQDMAIQALQQRVHDLEESLRQVTGQNEQLAHQIQELNQKLDRQQKDFEYRLCAMTAQQLGPPPGENGQPALQCSSSASAAPAVGTPPPDASGPPAGQPLGRPPSSLGTLSTGDATGAPPPAVSASHGEFESAMNLLAKAQYDEARAAFRSFADQNPKDSEAPLAIYWIGRIAYVQKDYPNAERAFAEVIKKYPASASAPESLLKLGQSLVAAGEKKEGCTALVALKKKYPGAPKNVLEEAATAHKQACTR